MRFIILPSMACPALLHFSNLSHKRYDFRKKLLNTKFAFLLSLQLLSEIFLILIRSKRDIITNVQSCSCKVPLLSDFNGTWILSTDLRKILKKQNFIKPVQREQSCSVRTDGHTRRSQQSLFAISSSRLKRKQKDKEITDLIRINNERKQRTEMFSCFI